MYINLERGLVFMLVMMRMTGMIMFNPILSRRNIPVMVNAGLAFLLAIVITGSTSFPPMGDVTFFQFTYFVLKELAIGLIAGVIIQMFMSALVMGGEIIDMQLGIGMAKEFDPTTNSSISVSSQMFNIMFTIGFFQSNAHLTLIHMTAKTFDIIPLGQLSFNADAIMAIPELFTLVFLLSVKLCLPILVIEVVVTFAVGMVMRVIPQINIFVVNIQFKLVVGLLVMVILVPTFSAFCENLLMICFENIQQAWLNFT